LAHVAESAAIPDHRVRLLRLEAVAALESAELVRPEVDRPVCDRPRCEALGELRQGIAHPVDEFLALALLDQQARGAALEGLDHHKLGAEQAAAVDVQARRALDLRRLREVDQELAGRDGSLTPYGGGSLTGQRLL